MMAVDSMCLDMLIILALLTNLFIFASPVQASSSSYQYSSVRTSVVAETGKTVGTVLVEFRTNNDVWMDYDFDDPVDCKLKTLTTIVDSKSYTDQVDNPNDGNQNEVKTYYIAPRDAVIQIFPTSQQLSNGMKISSNLNFNCPNDSDLSATIGTISIKYANSYYQSPYPTHYPTYTPTPRPTPYPTTMVYQKTAVYKTPTTSSTTMSYNNPEDANVYWYEGQTSGDGYYKHCNINR